MTALPRPLNRPAVRRPVLVPAPEIPYSDGESTLQRSALFKNLDAEIAQELAPDFETFTAERASTLFVEGDPAEYLYVVLSGKIKLTQHAPDGRETLVRLLGPSDQFGEVALLDSTPRTTSAVVVTDALLARLSKTTLHEWIARHPELATQLLRLIAQQLRRSHASLSNLVFVNTSGRVAKELLALARRFGVPYRDEIRIEHDLSQSELAQLVGATRETINKILSNYATRGWIRLETKCVVILDRERLAARAHP